MVTILAYKLIIELLLLDIAFLANLCGSCDGILQGVDLQRPYRFVLDVAAVDSVCGCEMYEMLPNILDSW